MSHGFRLWMSYLLFLKRERRKVTFVIPLLLNFKGAVIMPPFVF